MSTELSPATGGALTIADRSRSVSDALRHMARISRFKDGRRGRGGLVRAHRRDYVAALLFLVCFALPASMGATYYGLVASDRYETEARFAIRPAIGSSADRSKDDDHGQSLVPAQMIAQDTMIVAEYVLSRPMVEEMEKRFPLRDWFSRPDVDYFSRFDPEKPIEKLVKYWANRVDVAIEAQSGIITVRVNAFDRQESLSLTKAILERTEALVNDLTTRMRNNALGEAKRELANAEERVTRLRLAARDLRNRDGVLDARRTAEANLKMTSELHLQRIQLAVRRTLLARDLSPEARSIQELDVQIRQLDETMAKIERATTTQNPDERRALSATLTNFEALEIERKSAETFYGQMISANERARIVADRQLEFFSPVVEPVLAESAQGPRRLLMSALIAAAAGVAYCLALVVKGFVTR